MRPAGSPVLQAFRRGFLRRSVLVLIVCGLAVAHLPARGDDTPPELAPVVNLPPPHWAGVRINGRLVRPADVGACLLHVRREFEYADLSEDQRKEAAFARAWWEVTDTVLLLAELETRFGKDNPDYVARLRRPAHEKWKMESLVADFSRRTGVQEISALRKLFTDEGTSLEAYRRYQVRTAVATAYVKDLTDPIRAQVSEKQITDYCASHPSDCDFDGQVAFQARVFAFHGEAEKAAAGRRARQVAERARKGEEFLKLPGAYRFGITTPDHIEPGSPDARVFQMHDGDVAVVEGPDAYHVLRLILRKDAGHGASNEAVRQEVRRKLAEVAFECERRRILTELRRAAKVEYLDDAAESRHGK